MFVKGLDASQWHWSRLMSGGHVDFDQQERVGLFGKESRAKRGGH